MHVIVDGHKLNMFTCDRSFTAGSRSIARQIGALC